MICVIPVSEEIFECLYSSGIKGDVVFFKDKNETKMKADVPKKNLIPFPFSL
jgi:hypothetical protein